MGGLFRKDEVSLPGMSAACVISSSHQSRASLLTRASLVFPACLGNIGAQDLSSFSALHCGWCFQLFQKAFWSFLKKEPNIVLMREARVSIWPWSRQVLWSYTWSSCEVVYLSQVWKTHLGGPGKAYGQRWAQHWRITDLPGIHTHPWP